MRASPHPPADRRSGAVILDIHDLRLFPGGPSHANKKQSTRFADPDDIADTHPVIRQDVEGALLFGECERLVLAYSQPEETRAGVLFSLGAASHGHEQDYQERRWTGSPTSVTPQPVRLRPQFTVSRSTSKPSVTVPELTTLAMTVDVPSIFVHLHKLVLDGLQLWADDLSQMIEKAVASNTPQADGSSSKDASLIGSRFFAKTRRSQDSGTDSASVVSAQRTNANTETIVKLYVSDGACTLNVMAESVLTIR